MISFFLYLNTNNKKPKTMPEQSMSKEQNGGYVRRNDSKWDGVPGQGGYVRGNDGKWHWIPGPGKYVKGCDGKWNWKPTCQQV